VSRDNGRALYSGENLRVAGYRKVVDAIATDVRAQLDG
jgi:hypothetical protein